MMCSSFSEATTSSASQAISCIIHDMHSHYCCSQEPTSCPNPQPDESSPQPPIPFFVMHFNVNRPSMSSLSNWFCPSGSPTKILYVFSSLPHMPQASPISSSCALMMIIITIIMTMTTRQWWWWWW